MPIEDGMRVVFTRIMGELPAAFAASAATAPGEVTLHNLVITDMNATMLLKNGNIQREAVLSYNPAISLAQFLLEGEHYDGLVGAEGLQPLGLVPATTNAVVEALIQYVL